MMLRTTSTLAVILLAAVAVAEEPKKLDLNYTASWKTMSLRWSSLHEMDDFRDPLRYNMRWDYNLSNSSNKIQFFVEQNGDQRAWIVNQNIGLSWNYSSKRTTLNLSFANNVRLDTRLPDNGMYFKLDLKSNFQ